MPSYTQFYAEFGERVRSLRKRRGLSQEDMIGRGFSARHWQQIERGRPITLTTLLRIANALKTKPELLIEGLYLSETD